MQASGLNSSVDSSSDKVTTEKIWYVLLRRYTNMLQESCATFYIFEMSRNTKKGNLILQILSLVQPNQLIFHSCKTWILNYLIIGQKRVSQSLLWHQYYQKRHISPKAHTLMVFIITLPTNMGKVAYWAVLAWYYIQLSYPDLSCHEVYW